MSCIKLLIKIVLCLSVFEKFTNAKQELKLVQVIFRHGDRTPDKEELYPKLPYNPIYEELGFGQLTELGKIREHRLGLLLRERYSKFLGDTYQYDDVFAMSTDYDRTKMSLQLVLSGLYPPKSNPSNQFAIPMLYTPKIVDTVLMSVRCPTYIRKLFEVESMPIIRQKIAKYQELFEYLSENTGLNMTSNPLVSTYDLYCFLSTQKSMNISLPEWATKYVQKKMEEVVILFLDIQSYTTQLKRLNGGALLKRILQNMNLKKTKSKPKIYLYGGHDINVSAFARLHGLTEPKIPDYGSAIIVEHLWKGNGNEFIQMFLWTGVTQELITYNIPKCGKICTYDRYVKLTQDMVPTNEESECLWNVTTKDDLRNYYDVKLNF